MKTHTITINGTDYELRITGTIGIQILAQSFVPDEAERYHTVTDEEGDHQAPTPKWLMALLYAVFYTCHEHAAEKIDFMHFIMSFSSKEFQDAISWYYQAYAEREGLLPADEDETAKESDSKNA